MTRAQPLWLWVSLWGGSGCWDAGADFIAAGRQDPETEAADNAPETESDPEGDAGDEAEDPPTDADEGAEDDANEAGDSDPDDDQDEDADEGFDEETDDTDGDPEIPPESNGSDAAAPTIDISAPPANATFGPQDDITVSGTAQDNVAVVAVFVQFDSLPEINATGTNAWSVVIDATLLSHGEHTLNARAVDAAGNTGLATKRTFTIDAEAPTATLSNLPAAATASSSVGASVGGNGVAKYRYRIDNSAWSSDRSSSSAISLSSLSEGNHTLTVLGIDSYENVQAEANATTYSWLIDQSPPVLIGILPAAGGLIGKTDVMKMIFDEPIEVSAADVDRLLGTAAVSSDGNVVTLEPVTEWPFGLYLYLSVTDQVGNNGGVGNFDYHPVDGMVYVSTAGSDTATGTSASPFRTIQRAIVASNAYGVSASRGIAVAEGNYTVNDSVDETNATNARIYGGYSADWLTRDNTRTTSLRDESGGGATYAALQCGDTPVQSYLWIDGLTLYSSAGNTGQALLIRSGCTTTVIDSTIRGLGSGIDAFGVKFLYSAVDKNSFATFTDSTVTCDAGWGIRVDTQSQLHAESSRISGATTGSFGAIDINSNGIVELSGCLIGGTIDTSGGWLQLVGNTIGGIGGNAIYDTQSGGIIQNNLFFGFNYGIYQTYNNAFSVVRNNGFATNCAFLDWAGGMMKSYCSPTAMDNNLSIADGNVAFAAATNLLDANGTDGSAITLSDNDWQLSPSADCNLRQGGRSLQEDNATWGWPENSVYGGNARTTPATCGPTNSGADGWSMGAWERN